MQSRILEVVLVALIAVGVTTKVQAQVATPARKAYLPDWASRRSR